jgi:hypothetical protein
MQDAFYPMPTQSFVPMIPVYAQQPQFDTSGFQSGFVQNPLPMGLSGQNPFLPRYIPASISGYESVQGAHSDDPYLRGSVSPMPQRQPQMSAAPRMPDGIMMMSPRPLTGMELDIDIDLALGRGNGKNLGNGVGLGRGINLGVDVVIGMSPMMGRPPMGMDMGMPPVMGRPPMGMDMGMPPMMGRPPMGQVQGTPPGYFTKDHEQLEKYARAIGNSVATNIMFDNVSAEALERISGRAPKSRFDGPFADLSNPELYKEANHLYTDLRRNVQIQGQLLGQSRFSDPFLGMTFDNNVSKLGAMTVIIDRMAAKGWNATTPKVSGPMRLETPMNNGNDGHADYTPYAPTYTPMSTSPYMSNFNTMTTAPTYANYMLAQQPAWIN